VLNIVHRRKKRKIPLFKYVKRKAKNLLLPSYCKNLQRRKTKRKGEKQQQFIFTLVRVNLAWVEMQNDDSAPHHHIQWSMKYCGK
jgi:hypothetical protein